MALEKVIVSLFAIGLSVVNLATAGSNDNTISDVIGNGHKLMDKVTLLYRNDSYGVYEREFIVPLYDPKITAEMYGSERRKFDLETIQRQNNIVGQFIEDTLITPTRISGKIAHYIRAFTANSKIGYEQSRILNEKDPKAPYAKTIVSDGLKFLGLIMKEESKLARGSKDSDEDKKKFGHEILKLLHGMAAVVEKSPTGLYLKWDEARIKGGEEGQFVNYNDQSIGRQEIEEERRLGKPLYKISAAYLNVIRRNGYWIVLKFLNSIIAIAKTFKW